jgi:hypothetical protein
MGKTASGRSITKACKYLCREIRSHFSEKWAYKYPASNKVWKNTIAAFQTAGEPPKLGSKMRTTIGWTANKSAEPRNAVAMKIAPLNQCILAWNSPPEGTTQNRILSG